jgi:hypothetical protein
MSAYRAALLATALTVALPLSAAAAPVTIGFDGIRDFGGLHGPTLSTEDGVEIELSDGFDLAGEPEFGGGTVHLDDFGTAYSRWVELRFPRLAEVISVDILGLGIASWFYEPDEEGFETEVPFAYENVLIEGGGTGGLASRTFSSGTLSGWTTLLLGADFDAVNWLRITALGPESDPAVAARGGFDCWAPCAHFEVDNVTFALLPPAVVPLPPALPALAAGLGMLALLRRRQKR